MFTLLKLLSNEQRMFYGTLLCMSLDSPSLSGIIASHREMHTYLLVLIVLLTIPADDYFTLE